MQYFKIFLPYSHFCDCIFLPNMHLWVNNIIEKTYFCSDQSDWGVVSWIMKYIRLSWALLTVSTQIFLSPGWASVEGLFYLPLSGWGASNCASIIFWNQCLVSGWINGKEEGREEGRDGGRKAREKERERDTDSWKHPQLGKDSGKAIQFFSQLKIFMDEII